MNLRISYSRAVAVTLLGGVVALCAPIVHAQRFSLDTPHTQPSPATKALHAEKKTLVRRLSEPYTGHPDIDFTNAAIALQLALAEIAKVQLEHGTSQRVKELAATLQAESEEWSRQLLDAQIQISGVQPPQRPLSREPIVQSAGAQSEGYASRIRACIRPRVMFVAPPRTGSNNPTVQFTASLNNSGVVTNVELVRSSGTSQFDEAVLNAIKACSPFPEPPSGNYPRAIDGVYRMYD